MFRKRCGSQEARPAAWSLGRFLQRLVHLRRRVAQPTLHVDLKPSPGVPAGAVDVAFTWVVRMVQRLMLPEAECFPADRQTDRQTEGPAGGDCCQLEVTACLLPRPWGLSWEHWLSLPATRALPGSGASRRCTLHPCPAGQSMMGSSESWVPLCVVGQHLPSVLSPQPFPSSLSPSPSPPHTVLSLSLEI